MYVRHKTTPHAYSDIIKVLEQRDVGKSRIGGMKEEQTVVVRSQNPRERMFMRENVNWAFGLQECWAYWMGLNPGHVERYNSNMERYVQEDGEMLGSAYGRYLRHLPHDQIQRVIEQLRESPGTRRGTINIHNAKYEDYDSNDVACTMYLHFLLRNGQLNCIASLRSQDMLWGYPYDTQAFQWIQEVIAGILDVELGWYEHRMNSCHYYTDFEDQILEQQILREKSPQIYELPDCRLNESDVQGVELEMSQGLERARHGEIPRDEMRVLDTISHFYSDWLRTITAYEQHRFHENPGDSAEIRESIGIEAFRKWLRLSTLS